MSVKLAMSTFGLLLLSSFLHAGEKEKPQWHTFNDGLVQAKLYNKKVLIDVYTDWCGWCKRMDSQTYSDSRLSEYLDAKYVAIKLDAESNRTLVYQDRQYTEAELAAAFGINGYPSTIFLSNRGDPITIYPGYADAQQFLDILSYIGEDHYLTKKFDEYLSSKK